MVNARQTSEQILDAAPAHLCIGGALLKATPATEGSDRFVYIEASNEIRDQQGEVVLAKALAESADYYLKFGNLDIDHYTQIGAKRGIPNYESFEIGRPVAVRIEDGTTFVKGQIFSGAGPAAERANMFWSTLTDISPPQRWYPSVGGGVAGKELAIDPLTKARYTVISKVRWTNIGFSKTPVNDNLSTVTTEAFGPLAKSWGVAMFKGLEAGGGSDVAALTGGGALRVQSLDQTLMSYWDFRNQFANAVQDGEVGEMSQAAFVRFAKERFDLPADLAAEYVEQFLIDLQGALKEKR